MATRFYLPASGTAPLGSLAYDASWGRSEGFVRRPTDITKSNTSLATDTRTWGATATNDWVWIQFQSKRLATGYSWTTSDTVSMSMRCRENAAQVDTHLSYVIRVVSGDGGTIRGTIGVFQASSTEFTTTLSTKIHSARTDGASNFSSQAGDRIIIEIGVYGVTPTADTVDIRFGDPTGVSDCPLTAGDTNDYCGWVELSRDVSFDVTSNRSVYTKGRNSTSSNRAVYTSGANPSYPASSNRSAYTKGKADTSSNMAVYAKGTADTLDSRSAYLKGSLDSLSNRATYTKGRADASDNRAAFTWGSAEASSNRSVYTEGSAGGGTASSSRSVWVLGIGTLMVPDGLVASTGTWLDQSGGSSNLWQKIDESLPDDTDYVKDTDPSTGHYIEFSLSNPGGAPGSGDVVLFWRGSDSSALGHSQATIQLRQGASTVIASQQVTLTTTPKVYFFTLTAGERASITDWDDLRIRIISAYI